MQNFFRNLLKGFRTTSAARITRRPARRAFLQVEGLEDRLVPTTLALSGPILSVYNIPSGHTIEFQCQSNGNGGMEVFDNGNLVNNEVFNKMAINTVNIAGSSNNQVVANDSYGMPFAQGTTVNLSGGISTLSLEGSRAVAGNEVYEAGGVYSGGAILPTHGVINLDNLVFNLNGIPTVIDEIPITGNLQVYEYGNAVLVPGYGVAGTACLSYMGSGGGDTLYYSQKPNVVLVPDASNCITDLDVDSASSATLESSFQVAMYAPGETININGNLAGVYTYVFAYGNGETVNVARTQCYAGIWCYGSGDAVNVSSNQATVYIQGNSTTDVLIGFQTGYYSGTCDQRHPGQHLCQRCGKFDCR